MGEKPPNNPETKPQTRMEWSPKKQPNNDTARGIGSAAINGANKK